ncbi:transposase, MuDR [Tanacetum coccineum]
MLAATWSLRPDGHTLDSYKEYCNHQQLFPLSSIHGGQVTLQTMVKDLGYIHTDLMLYYKIPKLPLHNGLKSLACDKDVMEMYNNTCKNKPSESNPAKGPSESNPAKRPCESNAGKSFSESNDGKRGSGSSNVKRPSGSNKGKRPIVIEDDDGSDSSEYSGDSEDSDDSDFDIGDEDIIGDVDVDMDDFRKHTDENVEWTECTEKEQVPPPFDYEEVDLEEFGSGTESDDPECERKRALKKLAKAHRPVDGLVYSDNFYIGQCLANKTLIKEMVSKIAVAQRRQLWLSRNDKTRMTAECRGKVPVFNDGGSVCKESGPLENKPKVTYGGRTIQDILGEVQLYNSSDGLEKNMDEIMKLNLEMYTGFKDFHITFWLGHTSLEDPIVMIVIVQGIIDKSTGPLTPNATKLFNLIKRDAAQYKVIWNGGDLYDTTGPYGDKCVVNIRLRSCACRKWEITGMPCKHAVASIWNMANNGLEPGIPESWVHESYWLKTWADLKRREESLQLKSMITWSKGQGSSRARRQYMLKCGQRHNQRSCKGQRHQGSHAPPQASQASSQASQAPPSSSQDSQAPPSSSQASKVFTRFTKSTATRKKNGSNAKGSSKPPSGSKEIYRPRSVPKSILEWYGYDSVADYHADADYVPKKKVKSPGPIAVLGLPNKVTWMDMVKKMGIRGAGITGKGKGKV